MNVYPHNKDMLSYEFNNSISTISFFSLSGYCIHNTIPKLNGIFLTFSFGYFATEATLNLLIQNRRFICIQKLHQKLSLNNRMIGAILLIKLIVMLILLSINVNLGIAAAFIFGSAFAALASAKHFLAKQAKERFALKHSKSPVNL